MSCVWMVLNWTWNLYKHVEFRHEWVCWWELKWEIALTYISSFFHRSVACNGCGPGWFCDASVGHRGPSCFCCCGNKHLVVVACMGFYHLLWRWTLSLNENFCVNRWISSGTVEAPGFFPVFRCFWCFCTEYVAGDCQEMWSSPSERGSVTPVSGSSLHPGFESNLTRGKKKSS